LNTSTFHHLKFSVDSLNIDISKFIFMGAVTHFQKTMKTTIWAKYIGITE